MNNFITNNELMKLKWRSRRGILENDIIISKFLNDYGNNITYKEMNLINLLLSIDDNDLTDILIYKSRLNILFKNSRLNSIIKRIINFK